MSKRKAMQPPETFQVPTGMLCFTMQDVKSPHRRFLTIHGDSADGRIIEQAARILRDTDVMLCPLGDRGERLVDVDTLEHDVSLDVVESLDVVAKAIRDAAQL